MAVAGKYKNFRKALLTWLRSSTDLVSLTGHTTGVPKIVATVAADPALVPSLQVVIVHNGQVFLEVDNGVHSTSIFCSAFATTELAAMDIIEAVEELANQSLSPRLTDKAFATDHVKTTALRKMPQGSTYPESTEDVHSGVFTAGLPIDIRWIVAA